MSRRTRFLVFLAALAALACANAGSFAAAEGQDATRPAADASHVETRSLHVDSTSDRAFASLIESRGDRSSYRSPDGRGMPAAPAGAPQLRVRPIVTIAVEHAPGSPGGPAIGSRAPPRAAA